MKIIDEHLLNETSEQAKHSLRLRMNYNFHEKLDDPVNRMLNAMEPGTYLRPHRHLNPDKEEIFLLLRGKVVLFLFDDLGHITDHLVLAPREGVYGAEVKAGIWHTLVVLESNTVVYEVKQGPFVPLSQENFASWSPAAEDKEAAKQYQEFLLSQITL